MRPLLVGGVVALLVGLAAAPALGDDEIEIDERLWDAGFDEAFTNPLYSDDGARIVIDYDSDAESEQAYREEARRAAELVWDHLELRVLAIDVTPSYEEDWADPVPPTVSLTRAELEQLFGPRASGLDAAGAGDVYGDEFYGSETEFLLFGLLSFLLPAVVGAVAGAVVGGAVGFGIGRSSGRRSAEPAWGPAWSGPWAGPGAPPAPWPGAPWPGAPEPGAPQPDAPQPWPPAAGPPGPAGQPPHDPWRPA